jgi:nitrite reductase/ring-hydroxylating ferredoxin subunit
VHPPLPSLTTGAIGTTGALDALTILPGRPKSEVVDASRFASRARGPGIVANLGSALTGVTDWQHTHERDRRIGLVHGLLSIVATVFYIVSWWNRRRGRHLRIGISALGYGITVGSGYVGGALVFDSGIGIDRSGERLHTADWTAVLPVASLQDGKPQRVDGVGVVLCRSSDGRVSAFGEFCLHLAAPMSDGWVDRGSIVCPWHGSRFDIESGEVVPGPSAAPPPRYQTRISDGVIELRGDGQHATAAPRGVRK